MHPMNILIVHQNFPGQFRHLAPALVAQGHKIVALSIEQNVPVAWQGIDCRFYRPARGSSSEFHPWLLDFESKVIRGEAAYHAAWLLKKEGFSPDVIIGHPGWGECLFLKDIWPNAKLGIYCEFFYHYRGADVGFDPEFAIEDESDSCRLRLKNVNNLVILNAADLAISPTHWQKQTFPEYFQNKISVIHDGIDTDFICPSKEASITLDGNKVLSKSDEIITFINRNLEPCRGYHIFMRSLPALLQERPNAHILIVGGSGSGYGAKPPSNTTWREHFVSEVRPLIKAADWKRIFFLGQIPYNHYITILQITSVHVYLTYPFVLGWSLLEAMSAGCAIIASDTLPLREVIEENITGRTVDFFDRKGLVEQVIRLLDSPAERDRLGNNARGFAVKNYDLRSVCLPRQIEWVNQLAQS